MGRCPPPKSSEGLRAMLLQAPMLLDLELLALDGLPSLKLTASLHLKMDGWNTFLFPFGAFPAYFQGANC